MVANPYMTPVDEPLPWPETADGIFRLACVARLFVLEKGQDVLLEVLSRPKWRERPLRVSLFGKGIHGEALREAAAYLRVDNIDFAGFASNVADIWRTHHAVILPSRAEGLPLSLIEAMFCGRPGIVTKVGGTPMSSPKARQVFSLPGPTRTRWTTQWNGRGNAETHGKRLDTPPPLRPQMAPSRPLRRF